MESVTAEDSGGCLSMDVYYTMGVAYRRCAGCDARRRPTVMDLGRLIPTRVCVKHHIRRVDQLLSNRHLHQVLKCRQMPGSILFAAGPLESCPLQKGSLQRGYPAEDRTAIRLLR